MNMQWTTTALATPRQTTHASLPIQTVPRMHGPTLTGGETSLSQSMAYSTSPTRGTLHPDLACDKPQAGIYFLSSCVM